MSGIVTHTVLPVHASINACVTTTLTFCFVYIVLGAIELAMPFLSIFSFFLSFPLPISLSFSLCHPLRLNIVHSLCLNVNKTMIFYQQNITLKCAVQHLFTLRSSDTILCVHYLHSIEQEFCSRHEKRVAFIFNFSMPLNYQHMVTRYHSVSIDIDKISQFQRICFCIRHY